VAEQQIRTNHSKKNMNPNSLVVPTLMLSAICFWLGHLWGKRAALLWWRILAVALGSAMAIPGLLFVLYYFHMFDKSIWFYDFRALPFSELSAAGLGLLAGILQSWQGSRTISEKLPIPAIFLFVLLIPFIKPIVAPIDVESARKANSS
jgi:hypothetical protein